MGNFIRTLLTAAISLSALNLVHAKELQVLNPKDSNVTVIKNSKEVTKCYEGALAKQPATVGKLSLAWTTDKEGRVTSNKVVANETGSPELASCVLTISKKWIFLGSPENQSPDVTYDFNFSNVKK